jgi:hypothetical protein
MVKSDCTWHDPPVAYSVSCAGGDCHGHIFSLGHDLFKTEKEAVEAWNERSETAEIRKLRGALLAIKAHTQDAHPMTYMDQLCRIARAALGEKE